MATESAQEIQNFVTLKGSVELIVDFFSEFDPCKELKQLKINSIIVMKCFTDYSLNSILYQRGVFPEESFIPTQHYGLTMYMSKLPEIKKYIDEILPHLKREYLKLQPFSRSSSLSHYSHAFSKPLFFI